MPIQLRYCNPLHIGVRCWTGGFGAIKNGGKETLILQKVDVPIFPNRTQCEVEITKALREVTKRPTLRPTKLTPGELCAGGEPKEFCTIFCFTYTLGLLTLSLHVSEGRADI